MSGARPADFLAQAKPVFDGLLQGCGFRLADEHHDQIAFGSGYLLYGRQARWVRLVWDGREGAAWVETGEGDSPTDVHKWQDVEALVAGSATRVSRGASAGRLDALRLAVAAFLRR